MCTVAASTHGLLRQFLCGFWSRWRARRRWRLERWCGSVRVGARELWEVSEIRATIAMESALSLRAARSAAGAAVTASLAIAPSTSAAATLALIALTAPCSTLTAPTALRHFVPRVKAKSQRVALQKTHTGCEQQLEACCGQQIDMGLCKSSRVCQLAAYEPDPPALVCCSLQLPVPAPPLSLQLPSALM